MLSTLLVTDLNHSTIQAAMKKINFILHFNDPDLAMLTCLLGLILDLPSSSFRLGTVGLHLLLVRLMCFFVVFFFCLSVTSLILASSFLATGVNHSCHFLKMRTTSHISRMYYSKKGIYNNSNFLRQILLFLIYR